MKQEDINHKVFSEMVVSISEMLIEISEESDEYEGGYWFNSSYQRIWARSAFCLCELGVAELVSKGRSSHLHFRYMEPNSIRRFIETNVLPTPEVFAETLPYFLEMASGWGKKGEYLGEYIATCNYPSFEPYYPDLEPFEQRTAFRLEIDALLEARYLRKVNDQICWTEKIEFSLQQTKALQQMLPELRTYDWWNDMDRAKNRSKRKYRTDKSSKYPRPDLESVLAVIEDSLSRNEIVAEYKRISGIGSYLLRWFEVYQTHKYGNEPNPVSASFFPLSKLAHEEFYGLDDPLFLQYLLEHLKLSRPTMAHDQVFIANKVQGESCWFDEDLPDLDNGVLYSAFVEIEISNGCFERLECDVIFLKARRNVTGDIIKRHAQIGIEIPRYDTPVRIYAIDFTRSEPKHSPSFISKHT